MPHLRFPKSWKLSAQNKDITLPGTQAKGHQGNSAPWVVPLEAIGPTSSGYLAS
jgi:hypothetical protein